MSKQSLNITQTNQVYDGIDVSSYQGEIDFNEVMSSGIEAVYIKAGEGGRMIDPNFMRNYENATAAGLVVGFYYYVTALTPREARMQANEFYRLIRQKDYTARPAMDFENFDGLEREDINAIGLAFLEELERLSGITPMIYTDVSSAQSIWNDEFSKYPLWLADYSGRDDFPQDIDVWNTWTGYQYTDTGSVPGISGNVDLNKFRHGIRLTLTERPVPASAIRYTVVRGDSLWEIARRHRTTVPAIIAINNINDPALIYPGQILYIPSKQ